jgi:DNA-directed RNA polymerase subunit RPC12/RpoP
MTTIQVPYICGKCRNQFNVTMKAGEPLISRKCTKCGGIATAPSL